MAKTLVFAALSQSNVAKPWYSRHFRAAPSKSGDHDWHFFNRSYYNPLKQEEKRWDLRLGAKRVCFFLHFCLDHFVWHTYIRLKIFTFKGNVGKYPLHRAPGKLFSGGLLYSDREFFHAGWGIHHEHFTSSASSNMYKMLDSWGLCMRRGVWLKLLLLHQLQERKALPRVDRWTHKLPCRGCPTLALTVTKTRPRPRHLQAEGAAPKVLMFFLYVCFVVEYDWWCNIGRF